MLAVGVPFTTLLDHSKAQGYYREGLSFLESARLLSPCNVSLQYFLEISAAFIGIDLGMPRGSALGLVGSSGAGKNSVTALLFGSFVLSQEEILVDGTPLNKPDLISWQQRLGVLSQDSLSLKASMNDKISCCTPDATCARLVAATEMAQMPTSLIIFPSASIASSPSVAIG